MSVLLPIPTTPLPFSRSRHTTPLFPLSCPRVSILELFLSVLPWENTRLRAQNIFRDESWIPRFLVEMSKNLADLLLVLPLFVYHYLSSSIFTRSTGSVFDTFTSIDMFSIAAHSLNGNARASSTANWIVPSLLSCLG